MPKLQTRGYDYIHFHTKRWGECLMSVYNFTIGGKINAETLDDAVDILKLILEDQGIKINQINLYGLSEEVSECKKK